MLRRILIITTILVLAATTAMAKPWPYANEPSVAGVYNQHYGTAYDPADTQGLADLLADHGAVAETTWNTTNFGFLRVEVFDTGSTDTLTLRYGSGFTQSEELFDPGPWTSPSRGLLPGGSDYINLRDLIGNGEDFQLFVGNTLMDSSNTIMAMPDTGTSFLIGYNGGGWSQDEDFNEPLIHMAETPIPAAVWLLGSGLFSLIGLRRKMS